MKTIDFTDNRTRSTVDEKPVIIWCFDLNLNVGHITMSQDKLVKLDVLFNGMMAELEEILGK